MPISDRYKEEAHYIPKTDLIEGASLSVLRGSQSGIPGMEEWMRGTVVKTPVTIYDINGKPLFRDFPVRRGGRTMGTVRMSASKVVGPPTMAFQMGEPTWNFQAAVRKLAPKVKRQYPRHRVIGPRLVCYSYPKLGVMFQVMKGRGDRTRLIYDVADLRQIPERPWDTPVEGAFAWSYFDSLTESARKAGVKTFEKGDKMRIEIDTRKRLNLVKARRLLEYKAYVGPLVLSKTKLLQFCPHYETTEARSHHCFVLHGQQKWDYCAVATAQMILCYYRYYYSQDDIAPDLNYTSGSGCPSDQSPGYESLSCNHIDATFDPNATWVNARDQIDALHPLKSGIPGHARACAGYSWTNWPLNAEQHLYIYDPWPWNADYKLGGSVYWEDWDSVTHTNYVYTRLTCP